MRLLRDNSQILLIFLLLLSEVAQLKLGDLNSYRGIFTLITQSSFDFIIFIQTYSLWLKSNGIKKRFLSYFCISFIFAIIADSIYNIVLNVFNKTEITSVIASLFEIPFILFLTFQTAAWAQYFYTLKKYSLIESKISYLPIFASGILILLSFIVFNNWKIGYFTLSGIYQLVDTLLESITFVVVSICLITSIKKEICYLAMGYLIIISSDYLIRMTVVDRSIIPNSIYETTWLIGLILIFHGVYTLNSKDLTDESNDWYYRINSLQSQFAIWNFCICLFSVGLLGAINFLINGLQPTYLNIIKYLPSIFIILSMMTTIISIFFSKKFLHPLTEISESINRYLLNDDHDTPSCQNQELEIFEYSELKEFIKSSFRNLQQKIVAEKKLTELSLQVAHDIRSPLAALEVTLRDVNQKLPLTQYTVFQQAIQSIRDIANNLLFRSRPQEKFSDSTLDVKTLKDDGNIPRLVLVSELIELISLQKSQEWQNRVYEFTYTIAPNAKSEWILAPPIDIKRIVSNLLNNAIESLSEKGTVTLNIERLDNFLKLCVRDNGHGIPEDKISQVLKGISLKHSGQGLGLSNAKLFIENLNGRLELSSELNKGTDVSLFFPLTRMPSWFPKNISITEVSTVVILDDDMSIHNLWRYRFQSYNLSLKHFINSETLLTWVEDNPELHNSSIYLVDYELHEVINGLDILEKLHKKSCSYLITSSAEMIEIQKRYSELEVWLIPKYLLNEITVSK